MLPGIYQIRLGHHLLNIENPYLSNIYQHLPETVSNNTKIYSGITNRKPFGMEMAFLSPQFPAVSAVLNAFLKRLVKNIKLHKNNIIF